VRAFGCEGVASEARFEIHPRRGTKFNPGRSGQNVKRITPQKSASDLGSRPTISAKTWRCIIYIMRRTQLFLDDQLWEALHARARSEKTTISELVRQAARERYLGRQEARMAAMQSFVGIRKSRAKAVDSSEEVRKLRRGSRLERLGDR
jgi:predicted DNA-binding ribbon-helix-helix protein